MNGRLYDPLLRRFLNADENIQDPENTQIYNKYGYVANNPLMGYDRNGEEFLSIGAAILIGALIGGASYTLAILVTTGSLRQWSIFDFGKAVIMGGVSGAATFGIGELFKAGNLLANLSETAQLFTQSGLHGISQGFFAIVDGNGSGFFQGFISGALGSLAASGWESAIGKVGAANGGMIAFGALAGGIGAELSGGNFFKGFLQGGIVAGLNHAMNHLSSKFDKLWNAYPKQKEGYDTEALYKAIGGELYEQYKANPEAFANTCAVRMSKALNYGSETPITENSGLSYKGSDGKNYLIRVKDIANFVKNIVQPTIKGFYLADFVKSGIVIFTNCDFSDAYGHVDLINRRGQAASKLYYDRCSTIQTIKMQ